MAADGGGEAVEVRGFPLVRVFWVYPRLAHQKPGFSLAKHMVFVCETVVFHGLVRAPGSSERLRTIQHLSQPIHGTGI